MIDRLKKFSYPFSNIILFLSFLLGMGVGHVLPHVWMKVIAFILSLCGFAYRLLANHYKMMNGDELEKTIKLETLSISMRLLLLFLVILIVIENIFIVRLFGNEKFSYGFVTLFLLLMPVTEYFVRRSYK